MLKNKMKNLKKILKFKHKIIMNMKIILQEIGFLFFRFLYLFVLRYFCIIFINVILKKSCFKNQKKQKHIQKNYKKLMKMMTMILILI